MKMNVVAAISLASINIRAALNHHALLIKASLSPKHTPSSTLTIKAMTNRNSDWLAGVIILTLSQLQRASLVFIITFNSLIHKSGISIQCHIQNQNIYH